MVLEIQLDKSPTAWDNILEITPKETRMEKLSFGSVSEKLKKLGYEVEVFDTKEAASAWINAQVDGKTVGFGGSQTLAEMGLYESLGSHNTVYWHWKRPENISDHEMRLNERNSQVFFSSVNGLAETGEIINIDGHGNRVADIQYGHEQVYLVIGINKLAADYDSALWRARNIAAPLNAHRLGVSTPCAVKGDRCYNCTGESRICRTLSVLWEKPTASGAKYTVVLINENLGY